jgi:hypothetical protein
MNIVATLLNIFMSLRKYFNNVAISSHILHKNTTFAAKFKHQYAMKGTIHYSKYGHVQVVGENSRVYYTGLSVINFPLKNRTNVEFDVLDDTLSKAGNCRETNIQSISA